MGFQRYLQKPVINLGFSGHGLMQKEVGTLLAEIDASIFVLDCEYNMDQYTGAPRGPLHVGRGEGDTVLFIICC